MNYKLKKNSFINITSEDKFRKTAFAAAIYFTFGYVMLVDLLNFKDNLVTKIHLFRVTNVLVTNIDIDHILYNILDHKLYLHTQDVR